MKKFISLFLVFSILLLSGNLFAKEKRGANIAIYKIKIGDTGYSLEVMYGDIDVKGGI